VWCRLMPANYADKQLLSPFTDPLVTITRDARA
jgi:hypothetical protein